MHLRPRTRLCINRGGRVLSLRRRIFHIQANISVKISIRIDCGGKELSILRKLEHNRQDGNEALLRRKRAFSEVLASNLSRVSFDVARVGGQQHYNNTITNPLKNTFHHLATNRATGLIGGTRWQL